MKVSGQLATTMAWDLESEHSGVLLNLERLIHGRRGFTLAVLEYSDSAYRERVMRQVEQAWPGATRVDAREAKGNFAALEGHLKEAARNHEPVQLIGLEEWPPGMQKLWQAFNYHREYIAELCRAPLLLWILRTKLRDLALEAPDFWAWRSGVFDFGNSPKPTEQVFLEPRLHRGRAPAGDRGKRIAEINAYFERIGTPRHPADLRLLLERGELQEDLGDLEGALASFQAAAAGYASTNDRRGEAIARRDLARVLATRGDPEEALRILNEESLPVFKKLRDVREQVETMGQIADILFFKGDFDEALRIRREEELPVYHQLRNVRERARTMGKIADILFFKGHLDEALRIRREEELPVYEQLGDVRERALTMSKIADILERRGDLDEALRILRDESLPALEQLGDVRGHTITMGRIADVLFSRGDLDEALNIRREEELPVYERLGDIRSHAVTRGQIADILESRGDLDEALRIRREEELPVYEELGDVRSRAVVTAKLGLLLARLDRREEAREYFLSALQDAERLEIPEAEVIRGSLKKLEADEPLKKSG